MANSYNFLFCLAILGCLLMASDAFKDHIVGGGKGWRMPQTKTFYNEWAQNRTFVQGDKLVFMYRSGVYNILRVSKEEFETCTQKKVIEIYNIGPTILELTDLGEHYFYCGVGMHCEAGQKFAINVVATPTTV